ncbi:MAG: glycosyltransferase family 4 protein [Thermincolia bacterium]
MKIAFILSHGWGGSIQICVEKLVPLMAQGHEVTVFSNKKSPVFDSGEGGFKHNYISPQIDIEGYLKIIGHRLKEEHYDIVQAENRPVYVPVLKSYAPESVFITTLHSTRYLSTRYLTPRQAIECVRQADGILTDSKFICEYYQGKYPDFADKIHYLYLGTDPEQFQPHWREDKVLRRQLLRRKWRITGNKNILFLGRLEPIKGPQVLIKSMAWLRRSHPDSTLLVVGGNHQRPNRFGRYLHALAKSNRTRIRFFNAVKPSRVQDFFLVADVFACPSQVPEAFGLVNAEAMATGLPVVASNQGGLPEVIDHGETGLIVEDYRNPRAYARVLHSLLSEPEKAKEMAVKGRQAVEERFNWQRLARDLDEYYCRLKPWVTGVPEINSPVVPTDLQLLPPGEVSRYWNQALALLTRV